MHVYAKQHYLETLHLSPLSSFLFPSLAMKRASHPRNEALVPLTLTSLGSSACSTSLGSGKLPPTTPTGCWTTPTGCWSIVVLITTKEVTAARRSEAAPISSPRTCSLALDQWKNERAACGGIFYSFFLFNFSFRRTLLDHLIIDAESAK